MGCISSKKKSRIYEVKTYDGFRGGELLDIPRATNTTDQRYCEISGDNATFGCGGDFRSAQARFALIPGVIRTRVGYSGGSSPFKRKSGLLLDHTEVVDLEFDPSVVTFEKLIKVFWQTHDAVKIHGMLMNPGSPMRRLAKKKKEGKQDDGRKRDCSIIFYHSDEQKKIAELELAKADRLFQARNIIQGHVKTELESSKHVYPAAKDEQQYYLQQDSYLSKIANCTTSEEFQFSHLACKLNGFCSEFASNEDFEAAKQDLMLEDEVEAYVRTKVKYATLKRATEPPTPRGSPLMQWT